MRRGTSVWVSEARCSQTCIASLGESWNGAPNEFFFLDDRALSAKGCAARTKSLENVHRRGRPIGLVERDFYIAIGQFVCLRQQVSSTFLAAICNKLPLAIRTHRTDSRGAEVALGRSRDTLLPQGSSIDTFSVTVRRQRLVRDLGDDLSFVQNALTKLCWRPSATILTPTAFLWMSRVIPPEHKFRRSREAIRGSITDGKMRVWIWLIRDRRGWSMDCQMEGLVASKSNCDFLGECDVLGMCLDARQ